MSQERVSSSRASRRAFLKKSSLLLALQAARIRALSPFVVTHWYGELDPIGCMSPARSSYPPQLQSIISKLDPSADDFPTEVYVGQIEKLLSTWSARIRVSLSDVDYIRSAMEESVFSCTFQPSATTSVRANGPLHVERRSFPLPTKMSRDNAVSSWQKSLALMAKVDLLELEVFGVRIASDNPLRVETDIRYDLVGAAKDDWREERVGAWKIVWIRDAEKAWKISSWLSSEEVRSRLIGAGFTDITTRSFSMNDEGMQQLSRGIDDWRSVLDANSGIDVYGNHGLAVGDIDGHGFDSIYVCQPSGLPNRLYRNRGNGSFEDITESSGAGILDGTASALFIDFQNRGLQDLLVVRTSGPLLFINQGNGRFELVADAFRFARPPQGTFTSVAVADYNRDGLLDVYFCVYSYYQGMNQYQFPSPYYDAQNGPPNYLFRNRGDGTFEDVTATCGVDQNNNRFSFAAAWCDYDGSGWPSLYVANDFGRKNLYHNNGDGTFTDVAATMGVEDYGPGMSTCWLDYDNDGLPDVYVANMWLKEGKRITANDRFLPDSPKAVRALYRKHNAGNSLYRNAGQGPFEDKTLEAGSAMGRWSWSCASWDFDQDGYADLYVANGFVSGPRRDDLQSFFWRQVAQRSTPVGSSSEYELAWNAVNELVRADYSWSGYQRNVFFANNRDATFAEVSGLLGLDLIDDSRAFALSDFDHDGRLEFALKNRTGPQLRLMRNDMREIGNSVTFRLTGRESNRDAIGATLIIEAEGKRQTKFSAAGSGFASQHTKEITFGVGEAEKSIAVTVHWPSGKVQRYENVPVNRRIDIVEGENEFVSTLYANSVVSTAKNEARVGLERLPTESGIWLINPLFGPKLKISDLRGETHDLTNAKKPLLLSFFRLGCGKSLEQIQELQRGEKEFAQADLLMFAAAVDTADDRAAVEQAARSAGIRIPILMVDERTFGAWNVQYRYLFDRRSDIDLPMSFLFDATGALIRIYRGKAEPRGIVADWLSAPTTQALRFARAFPFPGPYYGNEMKHNYFTYGVAFAEFGYLEAAEAAFQRAIGADPNYVAGWFNLGTLYLNKKDYPEARRCLQEAVRLDPKDADAWNNLGMISGNEEKYDEALKEFGRAAKLNPDNMLPVQNMVRIFEFQHRPADAEKELKELILLSPKNAELHQGLAMTLVAQNENERAREELEIAVVLRPNSAEILNNLGVVLLRIGEKEQALRRFEQCQGLSPDFDRPYINSALIYENSGQVQRAQDLLQQFLLRHPEDRQVRATLEKMMAK